MHILTMILVVQTCVVFLWLILLISSWVVGLYIQNRRDRQDLDRLMKVIMSQQEEINDLKREKTTQGAT